MLSMQIMAINWFRQVPKTVTSPLLDSEVGAVLVVLQTFFTGFRAQPGPPTSRVAQVRILHQHLIEVRWAGPNLSSIPTLDRFGTIGSII